MDLDLILSHQRQIAAALSAAAMFGLVLSFAWPYFSQNTAAHRLREQLAAPASGVVRRSQAPDPSAAPPAGLRARQSALLARLVDAFRVSDRLNDGNMVNMLQQAGYRGRAAAVKYLAFRIISPMVLLGVSILFVLVVWPNQSLLVRAGVVAGGAVLGWFLPAILLKNRIDRRKTEIGRAWPDAVDLMLICVETGMSIEHAFRKVAEEMASDSIELAKEMSLTNAELNYLKERRQAYENLGKTGEHRRRAGGDELPHPVRAVRDLARPFDARSRAGEPRLSHGRRREEGGRAAAEADGADDPVLPARPVCRDHHAGGAADHAQLAGSRGGGVRAALGPAVR